MPSTPAFSRDSVSYGSCSWVGVRLGVEKEGPLGSKRVGVPKSQSWKAQKDRTKKMSQARRDVS